MNSAGQLVLVGCYIVVRF